MFLLFQGQISIKMTGMTKMTRMMSRAEMNWINLLISKSNIANVRLFIVTSKKRPRSESIQDLNFWLGIQSKVELCSPIKSAYYHKVVLTKFILVCRMAPSDLQPRYGNGVFYNIYLLALDSTKR